MGCDTLHHVPITGTNILNLLHNNQVVRPIQMFDGKSKVVLPQLRNRWLRNWRNIYLYHRKFLIILVEKLHHILHFTYSKSFYFRIIVLQIFCQPLQGFLSPTVCILTLLQHAANIPIHPEHFFISCINRPLLRYLYPLLDFAKQCRINTKVIRNIFNCLFIYIFNHNLL